jgi:ABC-2 type transport system permease protein
MITTFLHSLSRARGQSLGWGLSLGLLAMYMVQFYDTIAEQQEPIMKLIQSYPKELMAFFGDIGESFSPAGYLSLELFSYMPIIIGIYAVLAGSGLLAGDEESGLLDLVLAHPVSRGALFAGRLLAFVVTLTGILALMWLGCVVGADYSEMLNLSASDLLLPFFSLFGLLALFGGLALFLSMVLPSRRMAAMTAGVLLVGSYFLTSLARISDSLKDAARFSPLNYFQGGDAINGLNTSWLVGLLACGALFAFLAWWRFERRDIRVAGEGGWRLPLLSRRKAAAA